MTNSNFCPKCNKKVEVKDIEMRNVYRLEGLPYEYDAYCPHCGKYMYHYCYGNVEH